MNEKNKTDNGLIIAFVIVNPPFGRGYTRANPSLGRRQPLGYPVYFQIERTKFPCNMLFWLVNRNLSV